MVNVETKLNVADNSGAITVQCIRILKNKRFAKIGDEIVVSVKKARPNKKVKKGEVHKALIVRTKKAFLRPDGSSIQFKNNEVVLINDSGQPLGNRIFGPITYELKKKNYVKIISLASTII